MTKSRIAIFASGSGSNAEEIFKYFRQHPTIEVVLLLSNNPDAYALARAKLFGVPSKVFNRQTFKESETILGWLAEYGVTHIVLAGFLWLIPTWLIRSYPDKIVNIHPALLPKYGGKGMYGPRVHEAVRQSGDLETGITIHLINELYDEGPLLFQATCKVEPTDTPETIAGKVQTLEYRFYPSEIEKLILKK
ncbi:MAG TPA: phosphoribosylglycinamide formyltransferase [Chryseolinea sp.]|nr:phosphoribosylglycinamide formyltransferase [Chryseolinea sp.]